MGKLQACNIHVIGIPKEKREKNRGNFEVIMAKNFTKLMTDNNAWIQVAQRTPCRRNMKNVHLGILC